MTEVMISTTIASSTCCQDTIQDIPDDVQQQNGNNESPPPPSERSAPSDDERGETTSLAAINITSVETKPTQTQTEHTPIPEPVATENGMDDVDDGHDSPSAVKQVPVNGLKRTLNDILTSPSDSSELVAEEMEKAVQNILKRRRTTAQDGTEHGQGDSCDMKQLDILQKDVKEVLSNDVSDMETCESVPKLTAKSGVVEEKIEEAAVPVATSNDISTDTEMDGENVPLSMENNEVELAVVERDEAPAEGSKSVVKENEVVAEESQSVTEGNEEVAAIDGEVEVVKEPVANGVEEKAEAIEGNVVAEEGDMKMKEAEVAVVAVIEGDISAMKGEVEAPGGEVVSVDEVVSEDKEVVKEEGEVPTEEGEVAATEKDVAMAEKVGVEVEKGVTAPEKGVTVVEGVVAESDRESSNGGSLYSDKPAKAPLGKVDSAQETPDRGVREHSFIDSDCGELHLFLDDDDDDEEPEPTCDDTLTSVSKVVKDRTLVTDAPTVLVNAVPIYVTESPIKVTILNDSVENSASNNDLDGSVKLGPSETHGSNSKKEEIEEPTNEIVDSLTKDWDEPRAEAVIADLEIKESEDSNQPDQVKPASVSTEPLTSTDDIVELPESSLTPPPMKDEDSVSTFDRISNPLSVLEESEGMDLQVAESIKTNNSEAANERDTFEIDDNSEAPDDEVIAMEVETESHKNEDVKKDDDKVFVKVEPFKSDSVKPTPTSSSAAAIQTLSKFKSSFKDITREDLEGLIMEKMLEAMIFKSRDAENAKKIIVQDQKIGRLKKKLEEAKRQYKSVEAMHSSVTDQLKVHENTGCKVTPKPVLRTVGIQSQSVHYLRCKNCGVKATTTMSAADAAVKKINGVNEGVTITRIPTQVSPKSTSPTTAKATPMPRRFSQTEKTYSKSPAVPVPPKAIAKPAKIAPALPPASEAPQPQASVAKQPAENDSFVDLTEDDDPPVNFTQKPPRAVPVVASKPPGSVQRSTSVGAGVPPLVGITRNASRGNHALLRSSQPAPIPTQTVKRGSLDSKQVRGVHPAPLPSFLLNIPLPAGDFSMLAPPVPDVRVRREPSGIILSWTMEQFSSRHAEIRDYQLYGYQQSEQAPSSSNWKSLGHVKALKLPMAVTLTQFQQGQRYFFCVRARDTYERFGAFSAPATW